MVAMSLSVASYRGNMTNQENGHLAIFKMANIVCKIGNIEVQSYPELTLSMDELNCSCSHCHQHKDKID